MKNCQITWLAVPGPKPDGRRLEVRLRDDADPQELLRLLVERVRVRAFEIGRAHV